MKATLLKTEITEEETDLDLPVYVYYQDEDCMDELISYEATRKITIKQDHFGWDINISYLKHNLNETDLRNLTTKEHFEKILSEVTEKLKI
jgi:hypothetical protein